MSNAEQESASDALKRHFASRVSNQIRVLINLWRACCERGLKSEHLPRLIEECEKLMRHSLRFNDQKQHDQAQAVLNLLNTVYSAQDISPAQQQALQDIIEQLSKSSMRQTDDKEGQNIPAVKPILLAVTPEFSERMTLQFNHFGMISLSAKDNNRFYQLQDEYTPSALIVDVNFVKNHNGVDLMTEFAQKNAQHNIPIIFITQQDSANIEQRLEAHKAGGLRFFIKPSVNQLIRIVQKYYSPRPEPPLKVLIVDDSKSQSFFCDKTLTRAGMKTHVINDPLLILEALDRFQPEVIVMDMYMPGCNGPELAGVLRQQSQYAGVPILFLSGEEDINIQLDAMSQGGDDFLTKPINQNHLIISVQNRARRAREVNNLISRDSLTGLYNHRHTLDKLKQDCRQASENKQPLSFAMVDIDYFKKVNDNYGHPVGDNVILALSLFLTQRLRITDSVGRYGGEEFAVILPNTTQEQAMAVMNDIREVFSQLEHNANNTEFQVSFSCGICGFDGHNGDSIIEYADQALYQAKKAGRNNVQIYKE